MRSFLSALFAFLILAGPAWAGVGKFSSPGGVPYGELELEYGGTRTGDKSRSQNNAQQHVFEAEYGLTKRWVIGLEYEIERESPHGLSHRGFQPKAQYELTQQGDWWLSTAIKGEYLIADGADDAALKLLLMREQDRVKLLVNIGMSRDIGERRDSGVALDSRLQGTWKWHDTISPGIEWHAEYGSSNNFGIRDSTEQYLGPILTGKLFDLPEREFSYVVGYYRGMTDASARDAARIELEYQFKF